MLAAAKALVLALAITGVASAGVAATPLTKAIEIHKNHLGQNSDLPAKAMPGQQNALDHLQRNQERWLANPPGNSTGTGIELPEDNGTVEPD
jgi:hypothetical protein